MKAPVLLFCTVLVGLCAVRNLNAETEPADTQLYGPYPTNYKEIVTKWLETQLIDAESAHIEWNDEPKPANLGIQDKPLYGYLVNFKINARNRFGKYTVIQSHSTLMRE